MRKRVSNMHESRRRFNVASRKNPKEPQPRRAIRNSTEHMIQGPSKEHKHTNVKFCGTVIPNRNGKKLLIYYLQPTWEIAFQHMKIEELVE
jgi:hypothetical protein